MDSEIENKTPNSQLQNLLEIFFHFLSLGLVSFGGPVAHLGYFKNQFVDKLSWVDDALYSRLIALSHLLPGPGSSQVGFAIGYSRAGSLGGFAAFLGFTLPSFCLLFLLSLGSIYFEGNQTLSLITHGLKLLAVIVVLDAIIKMAKKFCTGKIEILFAIVSFATLLFTSSFLTQILIILVSAALGANLLKGDDKEFSPSGKVNWPPFILFCLLLFLSPFLTGLPKLFGDFYQTGSFVFGGGHVVLPILQETVGSQLSNDRFLFGYAAAQAIPGPMFSLASFLGAELLPSSPLTGAIISTISIFLPGFLLLMSFYDKWQSWMSHPEASGVSSGINASVVGILAAALYDPIFINSILSLNDFTIAALGFCLLYFIRPPMYLMVLFFSLICPLIDKT